MMSWTPLGFRSKVTDARVTASATPDDLFEQPQSGYDNFPLLVTGKVTQ